MQLAGGVATRHASHPVSFTHAAAWLQQLVSRHWSHLAFPVVTPQFMPPLELDELLDVELDPHWPAHCEVQAVSQMQVSRAESTLAALAPAVASHCVMQVWLVQSPMQVSRSRQAWSATHACVWLWQAPLSASV